MKLIPLGKSGLSVPAFAIGCMRLERLTEKEAEIHIRTAMEAGANFFDHADIYGAGNCETLFAKAIHMDSNIRETMLIQSKCGIRPGICFDFSKEHILTSVDGILKRLNTDYLDVLLLHRPDALMEPEEVAEAFDMLHASGKVRHFGMSNQNTMQLRLLQKYLNQPICVDQLQFSPTNATLITQGLHVNMLDDGAVNRDGSVLDYCRLEDITVQAWSPYQYGTFAGTYLDNDQFPELNKKLQQIADCYGITKEAAVMAWILRHPAKIQPILGTMNLQRLKDCLKITEIQLTREQWYEIYLSAGNYLP